MGYTVFYSAPAEILDAKFGAVAHLPCIFDSSPRYHRLGSRYLIDRALCVWPQKITGALSFRTPSAQSMKNYAYWLSNFLEWAEIRGVDLLTCDYANHIRGLYHPEMLNGTWSYAGKGLSTATVKMRVNLACDYLSWLAAKGYRGTFEVSNEAGKLTLTPPSIHPLQRSAGARSSGYKVTPKKRCSRMPTDPEIFTWLKHVELRFGYTKRLMCETILLSGLRREEVACWRIDTLPEDQREWHLNDVSAPRKDQQVRVSIRFGAKGPSYGYDHGDKIGPQREIWIPLDLAEKILDYRVNFRNSALRRWIKNAPLITQKKKRIQDSVHIFLDELTGKRIQGRELYNAWTGVTLPFKGWSPHRGRDWWACTTLWLEIKKHENLNLLGLNAPTALLESSAISIIRFVIQPQLGHAHDSTTMIYLQWIMDIRGGGLAIQYDEEHNNIYNS